jgi:hypothetical protein
LSFHFTYRYVLFTLFLAGFLLSCKKDRLKDGKEVLIGTWRWAYTIRGNNPGTTSYPHYIDTVTPTTEGNTYKMDFYKNGKIHFYKNGELTEKKRIVFNSWDYDTGNGKRFTIPMFEFTAAYMIKTLLEKKILW